MSATIITKDNFEEEVLKSEKTVLVDFWGEGCPPCKALLPIIDELASEETEVKISKCNVGENMPLARKFGIMSIPTLILFKDGEIANKTMGFKSKEELLEFIK